MSTIEPHFGFACQSFNAANDAVSNLTDRHLPRVDGVAKRPRALGSTIVCARFGETHAGANQGLAAG